MLDSYLFITQKIFTFSIQLLVAHQEYCMLAPTSHVLRWSQTSALSTLYVFPVFFDPGFSPPYTLQNSFIITVYKLHSQRTDEMWQTAAIYENVVMKLKVQLQNVMRWFITQCYTSCTNNTRTNMHARHGSHVKLHLNRMLIVMTLGNQTKNKQGSAV